MYSNYKLLFDKTFYKYILLEVTKTYKIQFLGVTNFLVGASIAYLVFSVFAPKMPKKEFLVLWLILDLLNKTIHYFTEKIVVYMQNISDLFINMAYAVISLLVFAALYVILLFRG